MKDKEKQHFLEYLWLRVFCRDFDTRKYDNLANNEKPKWVSEKLTRFRQVNSYQNTPLNPSETKMLVAEIKLYLSLCKGVRHLPLKDAVRGWGKEDLTKFYNRVGIQPLKREPKLYLGPSRSDGHYAPSGHMIFIDPRKNKTPEKKMKVLEFEILNAMDGVARKALAGSNSSAVEKAWKSIGMEYKNSRREVEKLIRKYRARNIDDLVEKKINMPVKILARYKKAMFNESTIQTRRVPMPSTVELKNQDQRNALFFYQVRRWRDEQIIKEYAYTPHSHGSKETTLDQEIKKFSNR